MEIKHSIIMICYNQEQYIRQALDSVLCERVKPYEIIIGDDFSTDGTRAILSEYKSKYPEIIKLILNEKNLGIFANLNSVTSNVNGDVISLLAGDDWFSPGLLESMNKKIQEMELNPRASRFILLPSVIWHYPDGREIELKNNAKTLAKYQALGSIFRFKLHSTNIGISRGFFNLWPKYADDSNDVGPWADFVQNVMHWQYCNQLVVMDCKGTVYRAGIGVSSKTKAGELDRSLHRALLRVQAHHLQGKLNMSEVDSKYLNFMITCRAIGLNSVLFGLHKPLGAAWQVLKIAPYEVGNVIKEIRLAMRRVLSRLKQSILNSKRHE